MIRSEEIANALRFFLGSALSGNPDFLRGAEEVLQGFSPWKEGFADLAARLEEYLFNALYPGMTVLLDDGAPRRIRTADLPALADAALFPLFASLEVNPANYAALQRYWMSSGSFSALRALLLRFHGLGSAEEMALLERIARETVPPELLASWLE